MYSFNFHPSYPLNSDWLEVTDQRGTFCFLNWSCRIADGARLVAEVTARKYTEGRNGGFPQTDSIEEGRRIAQLMAASGDLVNGVNALLGHLQLIAHRDDLPEAARSAILTSHRIDEALAALAKAGYPTVMEG